MARYERDTAILAKIETTYGTDAVPTGAADAILVSNVNINPLNAQNVKRDLIRPYFGGAEELVGTAYVECTFDVELAGSGTAGTAPAWGSLMRACAFAETITATTRVDYTPVTNALESVSIYWHDSGVLHKLLGARGDVTIKCGVGERPVLSFKFLGLYGGVTAVANPALTLTAWKVPKAVTDLNTADITLGGTHAIGVAPVITGGTVYPSKGIEITVGNTVTHTPLLGGESVDITQRESTAKIALDLTAAQEVTLMTDVLANGLTTVGLVHGTAAGNTVLLWAPAVQRINPAKDALNGRRLISTDLRLVPTSGNDELRVVVY